MGRRQVDDELCDCGEPLHYPNPQTRQYMVELCRNHGPFRRFETNDGVYLVPRHYATLHSVRPWEVPNLAKFYGWKKVNDDE